MCWEGGGRGRSGEGGGGSGDLRSPLRQSQWSGDQRGVFCMYFVILHRGYDNSTLLHCVGNHGFCSALLHREFLTKCSVNSARCFRRCSVYPPRGTSPRRELTASNVAASNSENE